MELHQKRDSSVFTSHEADFSIDLFNIYILDRDGLSTVVTVHLSFTVNSPITTTHRVVL